MTQIDNAEERASGTASEKSRLTFPGMGLMFVVVICCFTAWGCAADMTTPMVSGFKTIFHMNAFQGSLVQLAYYGAYFLLALPAAFINQKWGYKVGILSGLCLATLGAFGFYPASHIMTYSAFLIALFALAAGCSILETSANPFVLSIGPEATATRRLNFAQAFNPVGTNIGVLMANALILPKLSTPVNLASLTSEQAHDVRAKQLQAVMGPYLGLGVVLILIALAIAFKKMPKTEAVDEFAEEGDFSHLEGKSPMKILFSNKRWVFGVVAQFFNIAAQTCVWTYIIAYGQHVFHGSLDAGGQVLQVSLLLFLISRFVMTWVIGRIRPTKVLSVLASAAVLLCIFGALSPNIVGVVCLVLVSGCLSLMFPTIYGVALKGLGPASKFGAAGLVMAIVGGAIVPMVQGILQDSIGISLSFFVPAVCFAVVALFAVYDLKAKPQSVKGATA
ncbi:L-fucose:H+ symporter permease [Flexivirga caeni]|uniref:L-fucose:H+ symporter permease n=1 Tax=Flexivirga caeni TaxID=2294115 RepID=A0A3M9LVB0_9MICO|nr:L-fucose:H+ symporter permease [Flexivirga caeni]RNI17231.1 L-fucose:H+ symporter permease [Flexivirga caeni]